MPAHTKLLRTLGLEPRDNNLAMNLIAGGDTAVFSALASFGSLLPVGTFYSLIRLLDGYHLYGADIYRLQVMLGKKNISQLIDHLTSGAMQCAHCGKCEDPQNVLGMIKQEDESLTKLVKSLPRQSVLSVEAEIFFNQVQLLRCQSEKGCLEFFARRYGEVRVSRDILHMLN